MPRTPTRVTLIGTALLALLVAPSQAEEIPAEKRAAINELVALTFHKDPFDVAVRGVTIAFVSEYPRLLQEALVNHGLEPKEARKLVIANLRESQQRALGQIGQGLRRDELRPLISEAIFELYAENYSMDELKELIEFFSTPVGSKYARLQPLLQDERSRRAADVLDDPLARLAAGVIKLERDRLLATLERPVETP